MNNLIPYKDTHYNKGSPMHDAILTSDAAAKKLYDETTERFDALYGKDNRIGFLVIQKELSVARK